MLKGVGVGPFQGVGVRTSQLSPPGCPNELYDLQNDPGEENNLFGLKEHEVRVIEMTRELERFFISNSDPALDGVRQGVTGSGQLCRPGVYATRPEVFKPRPVTSPGA